MPKGPRGEKRPADVIGNAVTVVRVTIQTDPPSPTEAIEDGSLLVG